MTGRGRTRRKHGVAERLDALDARLDALERSLRQFHDRGAAVEHVPERARAVEPAAVLFERLEGVLRGLELAKRD